MRYLGKYKTKLTKKILHIFVSNQKGTTIDRLTRKLRQNCKNNNIWHNDTSNGTPEVSYFDSEYAHVFSDSEASISKLEEIAEPCGSNLQEACAGISTRYEYSTISRPLT